MRCVTCCRIALVDGQLLANPTVKQAGMSDLNLLYVGLEDVVVMLELQAPPPPRTPPPYFSYPSVQCSPPPPSLYPGVQFLIGSS